MSPKAASKPAKKATTKTGVKKTTAAVRSAAKGALKVASGKVKVTSKITVVREKKSRTEKPAVDAKTRVSPAAESRTPKMGRKVAPVLSDQMSAVLKTLDDRKVEDLRILKVTDLVGYTDFLIIGSGLNAPHIQSMADAVAQLLKVPGVRGVRAEGYQDAAWVLVDGGDFVVHLFQPAARKYYALEELWADAPAVAWP